MELEICSRETTTSRHSTGWDFPQWVSRCFSPSLRGGLWAMIPRAPKNGVPLERFFPLGLCFVIYIPSPGLSYLSAPLHLPDNSDKPGTFYIYPGIAPHLIFSQSPSDFLRYLYSGRLPCSLLCSCRPAPPHICFFLYNPNFIGGPAASTLILSSLPPLPTTRRAY